ncbi:hypothetical protein CBM2634_B170243 [Cupriavidus taiwanensis]|uniref:Uncharacterized protein n=1 Tax=Cupriavidus taiwanensis TaxID=164546 RepID=A0A375JBF1_9BURK|nr:hypothetical protein CBM2634_B170243 [Cupriavidus taiwanensis]
MERATPSPSAARCARYPIQAIHPGRHGVRPPRPRRLPCASPSRFTACFPFIFTHPKCTGPDILRRFATAGRLVLTVNSEKSDGIRHPHARAGAGAVLSTIVPKRRHGAG